MLPIKTILHPTDFSAGSDFAFGVACSLARDYGARVVVLHVVPPPVIVYGEGIVAPLPEDYKGPLREQLHQVKPADPNVAVEHRLFEGDAPTEILRTAQETKADVIVLGTHGRTGLARVVMGSVAEQVVRKAPCPVLTVKAPLSQAAQSAGTRQETATV